MPNGRYNPEADWGWQNAKRPVGIAWRYGTLEESFERVSRFGGRWILVTANPVSEFRRVMRETEEKEHDDGR